MTKAQVKPLTPQEKDERDVRVFQDQYEELCKSTGIRWRIVFDRGDDGRLLSLLRPERFNVPS